MKGKGLNLLTFFGKGLTCEFYNPNGNAYQRVYAFSITDSLLQCKNVGEKVPYKVRLSSDYDDFLVETSLIAVITT